MRPRIALLFGLLFVLFLPARSPGQTVYSDGAVHTVSSPNSGPIQLQNDGTTLNVVAPAVVSGSFGVQDSTAIVGQAGTAINVFGGQVAGVENKSLIGPGITSYGAFSSFGGLVMGGFSTGLGGATGVNIYGTAVIGAGLIEGGAGVESAGSAGLSLFGSAQIVDGTIRGGIEKGPGSSPGAAIVTAAGSDLSVLGGTIQGGVKLGGSAEIAGGAFQSTLPNGSLLQNVGAALGALPGSDLSISGGTFTGNAPSKLGNDGYAALEAVGAHSLSISGGAFQGNVLIGLSGAQTASIGGGSFSGQPVPLGLTYSLQLSASGQGSLTVSGGLFSSAIELGLTDAASASFIGSGLSFNPSTGVLTGALEDGSLINSFVQLDNAGTGYRYGVAQDGSQMLTFGPQSVPEPSSVVTFSLGFAGVAAACVRSRRRAAVATSAVAGA
jgi:hypothetical protein